ncbi:MAG: mobile mystery protein A [Bacteroidota bacterium]
MKSIQFIAKSIQNRTLPHTSYRRANHIKVSIIAGYNLIFFHLITGYNLKKCFEITGYNLIFVPDIINPGLMKNQKQRLLIEQIDRKLEVFRPIGDIIVPKKGWINTVRAALKMSARQLGERLKITPQSVHEIEHRESNGTITLKTLKEAANALDMQLVYGFIAKEESIEKMIEKRAKEIASEIVLRTSNTMKLEDQENSQNRINKSIKNKTEEIIDTMPKYLWD